MEELVQELGKDIDDADEEIFLLFSQNIPSNSLGFVDSSKDRLSVIIGQNEYDIRQSTQLLKSTRSAGTTGAVLWQVTPRFARWMIDDSNILKSTNIINHASTIVELGCGVSGILALVLAHHVKQYVATDQDYVLKILRENLEHNHSVGDQRRSTSSRALGRKGQTANNQIILQSLDWQTDDIKSFMNRLQSSTPNLALDVVVACDCIYNESLVQPFVDTCAEICRLSLTNTLCIVAQQLRSSDVFEIWLKAFHKQFRVWRMPEHLISAELGEDSGFVVHIGILRQ